MNDRNRTWFARFEAAGTDLIPAGAVGVQKYSDKDFDLSTKTGSYLPRLQLLTANSEKCKKGEFPINHYALVQDQNFMDVGENVDVLLVAWRPKAIEIKDEIIAVYDPTDKEFERIQLVADEKDSGCMFGPEFLVWIPGSKKFATFFMGSKSSRREAPNVKALLRKAATMKSHIVETKSYSWFVPSVTPCSTPFDMPEMDTLKVEVEKFNNPPVSEIEKVEAGAGNTNRDR